MLFLFFLIKGRAGYVAQGSNWARDRARAPLFTYVNEDKLKSIETYARKSLFFGLLIKPRAFLTSVSGPQTSLTCWTTMRCPLECQRRSHQRSFRRTGSSLIPSWRPMWWRCSKRGDIYNEMKNVFNLRKWGFIVSSQPSLTVCGGREEHVNSPCSPFIKKNTIVLLSMTSVNLITSTKLSF